MNSYDIYNENDRRQGWVSVLYHAIARDEDHVRELAQEAGYDLSGLTIDLQRRNVRNELGRPYPAKIESALCV